MARVPGVALLAMTVLSLTACSTRGVAIGGGSVTGSPLTCTARVTPDCTGYSYDHPAPGTVAVTAPKASGGNNREFFWAQQGHDEADATVCATFASGTGIDQQGVVVRLHATRGADITAITVTRNIWLEAFNVFNFHVWNTAADPASPFTQFGSAIVPELPVRPAVYPLNICVRTVTSSNVVQFVVWTNGHVRPAWGTTTAGGQADIPAGAPTTGRGGWFAGHMDPGSTMRYTDLTVDGETPAGLP